MSTLFINGRTLDDLVYQVLSLDGYQSPSVPQWNTLALAYGAPVIGSSVTITPRTITAILDVRPDTITERQDAIAALRRRLPPVAEIETIDMPNLVCYATLKDVTVRFYTGAHANPLCEVTVVWTNTDGAWMDREPVLRSLSTTAAACPVGTGVSAPTITLKGGATAVEGVTVTVQSASGATLSTLALATNLATDDALVIDSASHSLKRYVAGVLQTGANSGDNWLTSGDFPLLSGEDGESVNVVLSASAGTPLGAISYRRVF